VPKENKLSLDVYPPKKIEEVHVQIKKNLQYLSMSKSICKEDNNKLGNRLCEVIEKANLTDLAYLSLCKLSTTQNQMISIILDSSYSTKVNFSILIIFTSQTIK
jgi:hypothetical protein